MLPLWLRLSGLIAIAVGVWLNLAADRAFKSHKTTVKPFEISQTLLTDGVFRITRNPMYLGMVLILLGVAMLLGTLSPFLICVAFAVLIHVRFILVEEQMLAERFGRQWEDYRDRTRRWI
jgi:protein-S-isoprenylcysteine O-methyltransferase Ste14